MAARPFYFGHCWSRYIRNLDRHSYALAALNERVNQPARLFGQTSAGPACPRLARGFPRLVQHLSGAARAARPYQRRTSCQTKLHVNKPSSTSARGRATRSATPRSRRRAPGLSSTSLSDVGAARFRAAPRRPTQRSYAGPCRLSPMPILGVVALHELIQVRPLQGVGLATPFTAYPPHSG